jgi:hypothetical protein
MHLLGGESQGYGKRMKTKLLVWKAKMDDLSRAVAMRGSKEKEMALGNNPEFRMPIREMSSGIALLNMEHPAELASKMKSIDNGFVDMRCKYLLRRPLQVKDRHASTIQTCTLNRTSR